MRTEWGAPGMRPGDRDSSKQISAEMLKAAAIAEVSALAKARRLTWMAAVERASKAAAAYRERASCSFDAQAVALAKAEALVRADVERAAARALAEAEDAVAKLSSGADPEISVSARARIAW